MKSVHLVVFVPYLFVFVCVLLVHALFVQFRIRALANVCGGTSLKYPSLKTFVFLIFF